MSWQLVFTRHAQKDALKLASAGLKPKAQELLALIQKTRFRIRRLTKSWWAIWLGPIPEGSIFSTVWCTRSWPSRTPSRCCGCGHTTSDRNWDTKSACSMSRCRAA